MDLRKPRPRGERGASQPEVLDSDQSLDMRGDASALLMPIGLSAAKRLQEA